MQRIIISRTDNIGDVVLTIPLAGYLKKCFPQSKIIFLGKKYTRPVIEASSNIDSFIDWDNLSDQPVRKIARYFKSLQADIIIHVYPNYKIAKIARIAKIPMRVATTRRLYHWWTCNKLVRLSRKKSELHEAQLNLRLLEPVCQNGVVALTDIPDLYGYTKILSLPQHLKEMLSTVKYNLILHPKSKGSAREWGSDNFSALIRLLDPECFQVFVCGTIEEASQMEEMLTIYQNRIIDLTGRLTLEEYISFISHADGLIAASTGPLHIAAATGIFALGLYAPMKPIYPKRWAPIGKNAHYLVIDKFCDDCRKSGICHCIREISPEEVVWKLYSQKTRKITTYECDS